MRTQPDQMCICSDVQTLISSTMYLLSAFCASGCPRIAIMIEHHLRLLAAHPQAGAAARRTSEKLIAMHWQDAAQAARRVLQHQSENAASLH